MTFALLLLSFVPLDFGVAHDSVEVSELNHYYDEHGRQVFCQLIFWGRSNVIAWRMNSDGRINPVGRVSWFNDAGIIRRIEARTAVETWTQADPELADREYLPKEMRRELRTRR